MKKTNPPIIVRIGKPRERVKTIKIVKTHPAIKDFFPLVKEFIPSIIPNLMI